MTSVMRKFRSAGVIAALFAGLALSACASKPAVDSLASGAAAPGSQQDFVVNVGDRVFFETDQTDLTARRAPRSTSRRSGCSNTATTASRSKATPTSAAPANTTSRSAPAAPRTSATIWRRAASSPGRMRTVSYGKERPVAVCNDISCWSQNRRAVTVLGATS